MSTLYLHIGTPKTGTSAIQAFLTDNSEYLYSKGLYYPKPDLSFEDILGMDSTSSVIQDCATGDVTKYRLSAGNASRFAKLKYEYIYGYYALLCSKPVSENKDILLSSEFYWSSIDDKTEYFERISQLPIRIKVIVYLRRQDEYLSSVVNQQVKGLARDFTIKYPDCLKYGIELLGNPNYLEELEKIAGVIGRENIIVRRYGKGVDVVRDFLDTLNIPLEAGCIMPPKIVNPHLSKSCLWIMQAVNKHVKDKSRRRAICHFLLDLSVKMNKSTEDLFLWSESVRKEILDKYEESNNRLAKPYLNEERLFDR